MNTAFHSEQAISIDGKLPKKITTFWQQGQFDSFIGIAGIDIQYAKFIKEGSVKGTEHRQSIVIVSGRCESLLKYQELVFDLYQQGYNIFIIDHRGQGLSSRILSNPHKGYVKSFQDYVDDLRFFIEKLVVNDCQTKPYLLAHSMGGAIAVRYMQDSPEVIKAAVISSPMIGFNSGFLPLSIAKLIVKMQLALNNAINNNIPWYFIGQKNYTPISFSKNKLTHSERRYKSFVELYKENKHIQLGGVTAHWLNQCTKAQQEIFSKLNQLTTPTLLLQAGDDSIVGLKAQDEFCRKLHALRPHSCPTAAPITIPGAFHEVFFEIDDYRNKAIKHTIAWFKKHS